ncbi:hypothetical protein AALP_AA7G207800 [Arabis alpina]|uniref:Uncharacterized protein n=1 Tax=Arabis alpina TaxID=50452 RepID=A0A087GJH0_ARAAL|nr:hypothetical protein AALP_AA7G207800 [Arabis alpina]
MVIKRIELCIELMKMGMEFIVVVAEAVKVVLRHRDPLPPQTLLRHGMPASYPSPFLFGFLP